MPYSVSVKGNWKSDSYIVETVNATYLRNSCAFFESTIVNMMYVIGQLAYDFQKEENILSNYAVLLGFLAAAISSICQLQLELFQTL